MREKNHGLIISALPLFREVFKNLINDSQSIKKLMPELLEFVNKIKKLLTHLDPEYTIGGINDPFLVINLLRVLTDCLTICEKNGRKIPQKTSEMIEKFITYSVHLYKPNKKTVNSVLYEFARLALFFKNSQDLITSGFDILN